MVTKKPLGSILLVLRKQYAQNVGVVDTGVLDVTVAPGRLITCDRSPGMGRIAELRSYRKPRTPGLGVDVRQSGKISIDKASRPSPAKSPNIHQRKGTS